MTAAREPLLSAESFTHDVCVSAPVICPRCKGTGGYRDGIFCHAPYEHEDVDPCPCGEGEWIACTLCRGDGETDAVRAAVWTARGGDAPVQRRGYA